MKKIVFLAAVLTCVCSNTWAQITTEEVERRAVFKEFVAEAITRLGVPGNVGVIVTPTEASYESLAYTRRVWLVNQLHVYVIHVTTVLFKEELPSIVLEHMALHEVCHIAKQHFNKISLLPNLTMESEAEDCVESVMGKARHRASLETIRVWEPAHPHLARGRELVTRCLIGKKCL